MDMRSMLASVSSLSRWALSISSSNFDMPDMSSRTRLLSRLDIVTILVTSPCCTKLYPSALMRALDRSMSNSDSDDFLSLT
ncbi:MAG: hypothetical protein A4E31_00384 [Methanomassiliicoccales archaeon PtaU1.Bin030]|nr:MAG: hypothetical protein A4E31_00384 [Methanomassiliicoccales archaeon PtaU1.Bin030]